MAPTQRLDESATGAGSDDAAAAEARTARRVVGSSDAGSAVSSPTHQAYRHRPGHTPAVAPPPPSSASSSRARNSRGGLSTGAGAAAPRAPAPASDGVEDVNLGRVLGSYRLMSVIGRGGMGTVYRAEHVMLGRKVALKLLRPEYAARREAVRRFFNEARAVNDIGHENIVDIADYQVLESGETFFIMELLEGQDLGKLVRKSGQRLELARALEIALQVCDALEAAHAKEIIHRDLKPDNIFVSESPTRGLHVTLLDFGVAKLVGLSAGDSSLQTAIGSVLGTPAYMSPEQASGITVDQRTDIYSLGAILYEMFAGQPLFRAKSFGEYVLKHLNEAPVPLHQLPNPPQLPLELERVVLRCLAKDPEQRYPSASVLREALLRATGAAKTARRVSVRHQRQAAAPWPWKWPALGAGLVVAAAGAFWLAAGAFWPPAGVGTEGPARGPHGPTTPPSSTATGPGPARGAASPGESAALGLTATAAPKGVARLQLNTEPAGASVQRQGERRSLGTTPLTIETPLQAEPLELVFRLPGYLEARERVRVRDGTVVWVNLEAIAGLTPPDLDTLATPAAADSRSDARRPAPTTSPRPTRAPRPNRPRSISPGETVDPFAR